MNCVSLWQPWASAMPAGSKDNETRGWSPSTKYWGQEFAIHAAKRWTIDERIYANMFRSEGVNLGWEDQPPLGGIVGFGRLERVYRTEDLVSLDGEEIVFSELGLEIGMNETEYNLGNYEPGRFAWHFTDLVQVDFIPLKGQQRIWTLDAETVAEVRGKVCEGRR